MSAGSGPSTPLSGGILQPAVGIVELYGAVKIVGKAAPLQVGAHFLQLPYKGFQCKVDIIVVRVQNALPYGIRAPGQANHIPKPASRYADQLVIRGLLLATHTGKRW